MLRSLPTIEILECSVYVIEHPQMSRVGLLVEKILDINNFKCKKWNSNNGFMDGREESETLEIKNDIDIGEDIIEECDEEDDSDVEDCVSDDEEESLGGDHNHDGDFSFDLADVPQAFSCFTYHYTKRRVLACDLHGILDTSVTPPVFRMTDPVVHY